MTIEDRLRVQAARCPYGLLTIPDAEAIGISRFAVADACRRGVLIRLARGLYADSATSPAPLQRYAVPQRYLDAHRQRYARPTMPAALTGVGSLDVRTGDRAGEDALLIALPTSRQVRLHDRPFDVIRMCWDAVVVQLVRGLRLVDPAQATADEAHGDRNDDRGVRAIVDEARSALHLDVPGLVTRWEALGTLGAKRLLRMAADGVWEQESDGERAAFRALFTGWPQVPDCQVVVLEGFRVDFVFLDAALVVEYDGRDWHERRWEADLTRRMAIEQLGYRVVVVTAAMLREATRLAAWIRSEYLFRRALLDRGALIRPPLPPQPPRLHPLRTHLP